MEQQNQQSIQETARSKPPVKTNWKPRRNHFGILRGKYLAIVATAAILAVGGVLLFSYLGKSPGINPITSAQCRQIEKEIDILIKQASYCEADGDCVLSEEAAYPVCGCPNVINVNTDVSKILEKKQEWEGSGCGEDRPVCSPCVPPNYNTCQENRCVGTHYRPTTMQELKGYPELYKVMPELLHGHKVMVEGIYRWGFEDSNFDETADSQEYNIWVEVNEDTKLEGKPLNFHKAAFVGGVKLDAKHEGTAKVIIYGTFQTGKSENRIGYGHLGLWKHQIVVDKIVFESSGQGVEAVTSKIAYSPNEEVVVEIKNNLAKDIWVQGLCSVPFTLQQYNAGEWVNYGPDPTIDCIAAARNVKPGERFEYRINLAQVYGYKNFQIGSGRYRFLFRYSFANLNLVGQKTQLFDAFSNEFTIGGTQSFQFNARIVGSYASPGESSKVAILGNIVYLTDISQGLLAVDVSDPTTPKLLDSFKIDGGGAYAVSVSGASFQPHVLVGGYGSSKVVALEEIMYPDRKLNLQLLKESNAKRSVQEAVPLIDYTYFLAIDGPEFEVYDALTGESRIIAGTPGGHILDFAIASGSPGVASVWVPMLLAAQGEKGIAIFRVDGLPKKDPRLAEVLTLEGYTYAVDVDEKNMGYALSGNDIIVITIQPFGDQKILAPRGRLSFDGGAADLDVTNGIAAIAMWDKGVKFIDVGDPDNLKELGVIDTPGRVRDVELIYNANKNAYYAYVADDRDDLQIIEVRR